MLKRLPVAVAAVVVTLVAALDGWPALHGAPVLLLTLAASLQIGRELANALATRRLYPSTPVMNFVASMVLLHLAYFAGYQRTGRYSTLLELIMTVVVAMFTLVFVAAVMTDMKLHGTRAALRDTALSLLLPIVVAGGLGASLWMPVAVGLRDGVQGGYLVALMLLAAWAGMGAARVVAPGARADSARPRISGAGDAARLGVTVVVMVIGAAALGLGQVLPAPHAALVGILTAVATLLGDRVVDAVARATEIDSFRFRLPQQVALLQPWYDRWLPGGLTDYAGPLILVAPLVCFYLFWTVT